MLEGPPPHLSAGVMNPVSSGFSSSLSSSSSSSEDSSSEGSSSPQGVRSISSSSSFVWGRGGQRGYGCWGGGVLWVLRVYYGCQEGDTGVPQGGSKNGGGREKDRGGPPNCLGKSVGGAWVLGEWDLGAQGRKGG